MINWDDLSSCFVNLTLQYFECKCFMVECRYLAFNIHFLLVFVTSIAQLLVMVIENKGINKVKHEPLEKKKKKKKQNCWKKCLDFC